MKYLRVWCVLFLSQVAVTSSKTMRYRQGALSADESSPDKVLHKYESISVANARQICQSTPQCVTFSYHSPFSRFPAGNVTAYLYPYADWHLREDETKAFVEQMEWHTYINTTREIELVVDEVDDIMTKIKGIKTTATKGDNVNGGDESGRLRGRSSRKGEPDLFAGSTSSNDRKRILFSSLFDATMAKAHKPIAIPLIVGHILALATSDQEVDEVRVDALRLLIVLSDSPHTGKLLLADGVYEAMKSLVLVSSSRASFEWNHISITALDVISNICLHRGANDKLHQLGVHVFLTKIVHEEGFPGLQATLALSHLGDVDNKQLDIGASLPPTKVMDLVQLVKAAIDGDIVYEIRWDLLPGPLSAIKYLVLHSSSSNTAAVLHDGLLDAGLMEQLLRILEDDFRDSGDVVECALEIMFGLVAVSERARHMVLLAEHTIHEAEARFRQFERSARMAGGLLEAAVSNGNDEL